MIAPIAAAGFYVVAPDQRGYGETTGWDGRYEADLAPFGMLNLVQDCVSLLSQLKYMLAIDYELGIGVAHDAAMATTLYGKACDSGYQRACAKAK